MTVAVKICGLSTAETVAAAAQAGADFLGFVFHPKSPRFVTPEQARVLMETLETGDEPSPTARPTAHQASRPASVALVCDPDDALLDTIVEKFGPDWLQLHGEESPERVGAIARHTGLPVIKAVGIAGPQDVAAAHAFEGVADRLLLDAKPQPGPGPDQDPAGTGPSAALPGGQGLCFDWALLRKENWTKPWFLAGGLSPDAISEALDQTNAPGVDVSSGVESARGIKSAALIRAFVEAAKA